MHRKLTILLALMLVAAVMMPSSAFSAVRVHGPNPTLLQRSNLGTNWRSDLDPGTTSCYDSDLSVPIYLVDKLAGYPDGTVGGLAYSGDGPGCATHIELDRQMYNNATFTGKATDRAHEMDHLRGWTHSEGHKPDRDCTRETGENEAYGGYFEPQLTGGCVY